MLIATEKIKVESIDIPDVGFPSVCCKYNCLIKKLS